MFVLAEEADEFPGGIFPIIGITIAIVGNILINIALNIQRYAHLRLQRKRIRERHKTSGPQSQVHDREETTMHTRKLSYLSSELWWLGALIMTIGETGNFLAYGFAPASVVSPLGVFALVSNCIVAPVFFNEKIKRRNLTGVGIAIIGILLIIVSAETPSHNRNNDSTGGFVQYYASLDPHQLILNVVNQRLFKIYCLVSWSLIVSLLILLASSKITDENIASLLCNVGLVALFGAYTALSTKCLSSLLSFAIVQSFSDPLTYILMIVLALTAVLQIMFLNRALQFFDASLVIPVHFVFFTISVITASAVIFHDFENKDPFYVGLFFVGCTMTFIGVWLITSSKLSRPSTPAPLDDSESTRQNTISDESDASTSHHDEHTLPSESSPLLSIPHYTSHDYEAIDEESGLLLPPHRVVSSLPLAGSGYFFLSAFHPKRSLNALRSKSFRHKTAATRGYHDDS